MQVGSISGNMIVAGSEVSPVKGMTETFLEIGLRIETGGYATGKVKVNVLP